MNRLRSYLLLVLIAKGLAVFSQSNDSVIIKRLDLNLIEINVPTQKTLKQYTLPTINGLTLTAGKKTEWVDMNNDLINTAENNPRQVFARVPGIMVWEMDGTGNQVSVATRGLNPHRSWEMNVRQNGFILNSDLFGYPEAHYNPPMQAVDHIELVRGTGALQYGQQFGGMLNYVLKQGDSTKPISGEIQQTIGSFGLYSNYMAIGGTKGKWQYYAYYNHRNSSGWRKNSDYNFDAWHVGVTYKATQNIKIHYEASYMGYVNHFAAGLTDSMFKADPRQSNRDRNYFNPDMYIQGLQLDWQLATNTKVQVTASAILGQRNSVQFIAVPTVVDTKDSNSPRVVDRDYYNSYMAEAKILQSYTLFKQKHYLTAGVRIADNTTLRSQRGGGSTSDRFSLDLTSPYQLDIKFQTQAMAAYAENVFTLSKRILLTAGIRYESNKTQMTGKYFNLRAENIPVNLDRNILLGGGGFEIQLTENAKLYGGYAQSYRPVIYSDVLPHSPLDRVDQNIKDSYGSNSELGIKGDVKNYLHYDINAFAMVYNNRVGKLILTENGNTVFLRTNIGNTLAQGVEAFVEFFPSRLFNNRNIQSSDLFKDPTSKKRIGSNKRKSIDWSIYSSLMYNNAVYTSGRVAISKTEVVDIKNKRLENAPQIINRSGLNLHYKTFSIALQASYVSKCYTDALNTKSSADGVNGIVPAYTLFDINMAYSINKNLKAKVAVNNLLNKMYFTRRATGYPGPGLLPSDGRSIVLSLSANF